MIPHNGVLISKCRCYQCYNFFCFHKVKSFSFEKAESFIYGLQKNLFHNFYRFRAITYIGIFLLEVKCRNQVSSIKYQVKKKLPF